MKRSFLRKFTRSVNRPNGGGVTLLLLLAVTVPSLGLLWFMYEAMQNEKLAVRQKLEEVYRENLELARVRLRFYWRTDASVATKVAWDASKNGPTIQFDAPKWKASEADAIVVLASGTNVIYPATVEPPAPVWFPVLWTDAQQLEATDPAAAAPVFAAVAEAATNANAAARARQAQARCLLHAGKRLEAVAVLRDLWEKADFAGAVDEGGREIVPNAELMVLEMTKDSDPAAAAVVFDRLKGRLLDDGINPMPSAQHRFLLHRLAELYPTNVRFRTLNGQDLAAAYLESKPALPPYPGLRSTSLPDIWEFVPGDRGAIQLYRTGTLKTLMLAAATNGNAGTALPLPSEVNLTLVPPGKSAVALMTAPAGVSAPDWQIALSLKDARYLETAAGARVAFFLWTGLLTVAAMAGLGLLAAALLRRQIAVAQLKNDLVANVTHELKTPLSSMRLLVETLLNSPKLEEKTAREYLQLIARENLRLSHLIDNFLAFSRIERDKYAFEFRTVPAQEIVDNAAGAVRERFTVPGCRFATKVSADLPRVQADSGAMVTALVNLLDNAWKYSGDDKEIVLTAQARNGSVIFAVKDNGIGLPAAEKDRIFKRFYQVDPTLSRTGSGCGLGLSIVQFIVTAHHGTVKVESEPGKGSTFSLTLPAEGLALSPRQRGESRREGLPFS